MNNIFICKICNKEFNSIHALSLHLKLHNISAEEYYKKYLLKPGFYKEDEIIYKKGLTAKRIWEKDMLKDKMAESVGIKLIRIKEYDWINDNENIKNYITSIIFNN